MYTALTMGWEFDILIHLILRIALAGRTDHPQFTDDETEIELK